MKQFALITGASSGLGKAIAYELAGKGRNLLLVSLPNENLKSVCENCRNMNVDCDFYEMDLTDFECLDTFVRLVNERYEINLLINNAGIGGSRKFDSVSMDYLMRIIRLNVMATTVLTRALIPNLKRNSPAGILNISSMAALTPTGFKTIYPASKSYIKQFSLGLREELKGFDINVSVALPGPLPTGEDVIRRIRRQGFVGRMMCVSPIKMARVCIKGLFSHKRIIVAGRLNTLVYMILKFIPEPVCSMALSQAVRKNEI